MTTGLFDRSSMARPPTRTGIMLMTLLGPLRGSGFPGIGPRGGTIVPSGLIVVQVGSRLSHVVEHPLRGAGEIRVGMEPEEFLECRAGQIVLPHLFRIGE